MYGNVTFNVLMGIHLTHDSPVLVLYVLVEYCSTYFPTLRYACASTSFYLERSLLLNYINLRNLRGKGGSRSFRPSKQDILG